MYRVALPLVLMLLVWAPARAQDPVKVDPAHHKVELENEFVRVLRITFGPGEKAPLHEHPAGAAVFLTDHQATVTPEGGKPDPTPRKRGGVVATTATKHTVENPGPGKSEVVLIELKTPPTKTLTQDAVKVDPKHYTAELENDRIRVVRVRYGPHEKSVMHEHYPAVAVILAGGKMTFTDKAGKNVDQSLPSDSIIWDPGDAHLPQSHSDKPIEVILIELKPKAKAS